LKDNGFSFDSVGIVLVISDASAFRVTHPEKDANTEQIVYLKLVVTLDNSSFIA